GVFEPQNLAVSNLNRYVLMRRSMGELAKTLMAERWARPEVTIVGHRLHIDEQTVASIGPWSPRVIVGTDNVSARWLVQRSWPKWLAVAGTAGFMVLASEHEPGQPCAGCVHAWTEDVTRDVPTASFVSYWGGLLAAVRLLR